MKRMPWKSERDGEGLERLVREKNTGRQLWREGREREVKMLQRLRICGEDVCGFVGRRSG